MTTRTPTLRARALTIAKGLVGVMEHGGNNRGTMVEKIIHANGGVTGEPWCGDFVAYAYKLAGSKSVERRWASTIALAFGGLAGLLRLGLRRGKAGDILVYNFAGGDRVDHTGLLVGYYRRRSDGTYVHCHADVATHVRAIEGNTGASGSVSDSAAGDGVREKYRPIGQVRRVLRVLR